jgi:parallel beta-helix repeat protein
MVAVLAGSCDSTSVYPRPSVTLPPPTTSTAEAAGTPTTVSTSSVLPDDAAATVPRNTSVSTSDDLAALVAAAPEGSTFMLESGVHRASEIVPKDGMTFAGEPGAVLSGAVVLDGFSSSGDYWQISSIEFGADSDSECIDGYESCGKPNDVFVDGVMLWRADTLEELEPGSWWGGDDRIVLADDPTGRVVELSVVAHAIIGAASDVTIRDLVIEKYAVPSQDGAVQAQEPGDGERGAGWLLEDVEIRNNHAAGLRTGDGTEVRRVFSHHNGQLGIAVSGGTDVTISDSELAYNNTRGYFWEWEGGGGKFTRTENLIVRGTYSHDNLGPGLWTDIDCVDTLYESNRVIDNLGPGIFHEISGAAVIRDNEVSGNGFGKSNWAWGAGILIAASFDVEVIGNRVFDNADAITGVQQERGSGPIGERLLARLFVHDNDVELSNGVTGVVSDTSAPGLYTDRDIRFEANRYTGVGNRQAYAWDSRYLTAWGWRAVGQDVDGTWE